MPRCLFKVDVRPKTGLTNVNAVPDAAPHFGVCSKKRHPDAVPKQAPVLARPQDSANRLPRPLRAAQDTRRETSMAEEEAAPDAADAATVEEEPPKPPPEKMMKAMLSKHGTFAYHSRVNPRPVDWWGRPEDTSYSLLRA